jgi:DNA-binding NarL/FixJ family response regulator
MARRRTRPGHPATARRSGFPSPGAIVVSITNTVLAAAQNAAAEARARSRFQMTDEQLASSVGTFLGEIMASGAYPRHLQTIGCQASGVISDQDLVKAVRSETASHDYDEVILATGRQGGSRLARISGRDPLQQLRRKWGQQLIVFLDGRRQESPSRASSGRRLLCPRLPSRRRSLIRAELAGLRQGDPGLRQQVRAQQREADVARLVADGLSNKEIGGRLFISERTVESHVRSIMNKLGFNSRAQVAGWMTAPDH